MCVYVWICLPVFLHVHSCLCVHDCIHVLISGGRFELFLSRRPQKLSEEIFANIYKIKLFDIFKNVPLQKASEDCLLFLSVLFRWCPTVKNAQRGETQ